MQHNPDLIQDIFDQAAELPMSEREAYLDEKCHGDAVLKAKIQSWLAQLKKIRTVEGVAPSQQPGPYAPGDRLGQYTITRQLGAGGFGVVYLARQDNPSRDVAIKVILPEYSGRDSKFLERFKAEQEALARLEHPYIATLYTCGQDDQARPYIVMQYIDGEHLDTACDSHQLDIGERLRIAAELCDAVSHAHSKGLIHRDLKPGNILLSRNSDDEKWHPTVIDFGIAKAIEMPLSAQELTQGGRPMGTYGYMSPEQADGDLKRIGISTDVYALGVILYQLLAGRLPLEQAELDEYGEQAKKKMIREVDPPRPGSWLKTSSGQRGQQIAMDRSTEIGDLSRVLSRELEHIPMRALRKEPEERYDSAKIMGDDIRRYLKGDRLVAGPDSAAYRLRKSIRRNKGAYSAVAAIILVLIAGVVVSLMFAFEADQLGKSEAKQRKIAQEQAREAGEAQTEAVRQAHNALRSAYYGNLRAVSASLSEGDLAGARKWLKQAKAAMISSQSSRSNAESVLDTVVAASEITERQKNEKLNEMRLASAEHSLVREDYAQTDAFKIEQKDMPFEWQYLHARTHANSEIAKLLKRDDGIDDGISNFVWSVTFSPDGERLASAGGDNTIRLWDVATGEELAVLRGNEAQFHPSGALFVGGCVFSVAFSPDGQQLASTGTDNTIRLWNAGNGEELAILRVRHDRMEQLGRSSPLVTRSVAFSPDGTRLASGGGKIIRLWDAGSGEKLALRGHEGDVYSVTFSPDGTRLASGGPDKTIRLWDVATGEELAVLRGHSVTSVTFSPDGQRLASAGPDKTIRLWDAGSGKELAVLRGHKDHVFSVAFSPDGQRLASGSRDDTIRLWDAGSGEELAVLSGYEPNSVFSVAFSPDGERLASGGADNTIQLWGVTKDATGGKELSVLRGHEGGVQGFAFSPDGTRLASGGWDKTIRLWDVDSCEELAVLRGHEDRVFSVKFSPDGRQLASASRDDTIRLWDAGSGEELAVLRGHEKVSSVSPSIKSVAFSPDGQQLASRGMDGTIRLWDTSSGEELAVLCGHTNLGGWGRNNLKRQAVESCTFSPDGQRLASGGRDKTIRLWDTGSGEELAVLSGHEGRVFSVKFSPDGQRLASAGGRDKTIRLWDAGSGKELAVLRGHEFSIRSVTFSPDGELLASVGGGNTIRLWDAGSGEELAVLSGYGSPIRSVTFSPDGERLASAGVDKTIRLWDAGSGKELAVLRGHEDYVSSVAFSPDGKRLASGSGDGTIRLWETRSRGQIAQDRRLSQEEMLRLTPKVEDWIETSEKSGGDDELVVALLEQEVKNRKPKEATTLRNLVLKKLVQRRQAKKAEMTESAAP